MGRTCMSSAAEANRRVVCDACPLCAATSWSAHAGDASTGFEWVRCSCGCVFKRSETGEEDAAPGVRGERRGVDDDSNPALRGEPRDCHYDEDYFSRYDRRRRRRVAKSRRQIRDALEFAPPGRLLDVGCSLGYALEAAKSLGLDAAGVDVSAHAVADCVSRGLAARRGGLDDLPFEDATFAIVVLKHVFEHTPAPRRTLAELRRVLVPGGAAFFAVPNLEYFKAARSPRTSRFFTGEGGKAHYVYYTPATLTRLLEQEGFRVARVHPVLVHARASVIERLGEMAIWPLRAPLAAIASAAALRKEFWLVATSDEKHRQAK
jgi:SAM-dependent methyltransferase